MWKRKRWNFSRFRFRFHRKRPLPPLPASASTSLVKNSQDIKLIWPRDSSNDIITTEQSNRLQKLYIYKNYTYNAHLFICDNSLQAKLDYPKCDYSKFQLSERKSCPPNFIDSRTLPLRAKIEYRKTQLSERISCLPEHYGVTS